MSGVLKVLVVGDAIGRPGRDALKRIIPRLRDERGIDVVIANGENSAAGKGITGKTAAEMRSANVDVITTGNHVWDNKEALAFIDGDDTVLRPANFPEGVGVPGRGWGVFTSAGKVKYAVINLIGRVLMSPNECPFRKAQLLVEEARKVTPVVIVDFHAEATSEKNALGWYLDGQASFVFGTHTHVPTADWRLLPNGTAYVTDIGMTGSYDSVIGMKYETVIDRFVKGLPAKYEVAEKNVWLSGALVTVNTATGRAESIERVWEQ